MNVQQKLQTIRILWFALFSSTLMFIVVRFVVPPASVTPEPLMLPISGMAALTVLVVSVILPRRFLELGMRSRKVEIIEADDPKASSDVIPGGEGPKRRVFADRNAALAAAFPVYQTPFILGMALSESIALFGFALWHVGFGLYEGLPFFVVAWISMAFRFPSLEKLVTAMERAHGAVMPPG